MLDPLVEQMQSLLRITPRADEQTAGRSRRFSDTDRPSSLGQFAGPAWPRSPAKSNKQEADWQPSEVYVYGACEDSMWMAPHFCSAEKCSILTVFETTELLESILQYLETPDVLVLRRTDRSWHDLVQRSLQLRLHFFTYAQWNRPAVDFQLLPLKLPGLKIERGDEVPRGQWIVISMTRAAALQIARDANDDRRVRARSIFEGLRGGLGRRRRSPDDTWPSVKPRATFTDPQEYDGLFVTQPPLLGMQAYHLDTIIGPSPAARQSDLPGDSDHLTAPQAKLSCEAGITLGFLAETALSLLSACEAGPSTAGEAKVAFTAIMSFTEPDLRRRTRSAKRTVVSLR